MILFGHKVSVAAWLTVNGGYYFIQESKEDAESGRLVGPEAQDKGRCFPVGLRKTATDHEPIAGKKGSVAYRFPESVSKILFLLVKAFRSLRNDLMKLQF